MIHKPNYSETTSGAIFVEQSRDALIFLELVHDQPLRAELRGVITKVRKHGGLIFYNFEDATATIQLIAKRDHFNENDWKQMCLIKPSNRIIAKGLITHSKTGEPSIILDETLIPLYITEPTNENRTVRDLDRVGVRLFLARLRYKAETFFRSSGFLQIEPNFISTSWSIRGIEPLRVQYEGFGVPTYLTPSPSPQLLAAMEATGYEKVFAVGRCFTTTYRDETTSAESLILMAKIAQSTIDEIVNISQLALSTTLGDTATMPENYNKIMKNGWHLTILGTPPKQGNFNITEPTIQIYDLPTESINKTEIGAGIITIFRICWPPRYILVEGSVRKLIGQKGIGTLTLFLERAVPLLKDVPLRQLGDLQMAGM